MTNTAYESRHTDNYVYKPNYKQKRNTISKINYNQLELMENRTLKLSQKEGSYLSGSSMQTKETALSQVTKLYEIKGNLLLPYLFVVL